MEKTLFKAAAAGTAAVVAILMIAVLSGTKYAEYRPVDYRGEQR